MFIRPILRGLGIGGYRVFWGIYRDLGYFGIWGEICILGVFGVFMRPKL